MNSDKFIKIKYNDNVKLPIYVTEYIIYSDESKYALFNLFNNSNQIIRSIKLEIKELDDNNNLLITKEFTYDNFFTKSKKEFQPFEKYLLLDNTTKLEIKVIYALFSTHEFINGEMKLIDSNDFNYNDLSTMKKLDKRVKQKERLKHQKINFIIILIVLIICAGLTLYLTYNNIVEYILNS